MQAGLDRALYRRCSLLVLASATLAGADLPPVPTVVVPPGGRAALDRHAARTCGGGRRAALLSVGNWVARKGTLDLLEAFARLPRTWPRSTSSDGPTSSRRYGRGCRPSGRRPDLAGAWWSTAR